MSFVKPEKSDFQAPPIREISDRRERRVGRVEISEDLERLREEESKKDSKCQPMD